MHHFIAHRLAITIKMCTIHFLDPNPFLAGGDGPSIICSTAKDPHSIYFRAALPFSFSAPIPHISPRALPAGGRVFFNNRYFHHQLPHISLPPAMGFPQFCCWPFLQAILILHPMASNAVRSPPHFFQTTRLNNVSLTRVSSSSKQKSIGFKYGQIVYFCNKIEFLYPSLYGNVTKTRSFLSKKEVQFTENTTLADDIQLLDRLFAQEQQQKPQAPSIKVEATIINDEQGEQRRRREEPPRIRLLIVGDHSLFQKFLRLYGDDEYAGKYA